MRIAQTVFCMFTLSSSERVDQIRQLITDFDTQATRKVRDLLFIFKNGNIPAGAAQSPVQKVLFAG